MQSICNKQAELQQLLIDDSPGVISISQTWLTENIHASASDNATGISDYILFFLYKIYMSALVVVRP